MWRSLRWEARSWATLRSWVITSVSCGMSSATTRRGEPGAERQVEAGRRDCQQERGDRPPCSLQRGAADQGDEQAVQHRRGREVLEAPDGQGGVDGREQHRADQQPVLDDLAPGQVPGAEHGEQRDAEDDEVGPGGNAAAAAREIAPHAHQRDHRPLQAEDDGEAARAARSGPRAHASRARRRDRGWRRSTTRRRGAGAGARRWSPPSRWRSPGWPRRPRAGTSSATAASRNDRQRAAAARAAGSCAAPAPCGKTVTNWHAGYTRPMPPFPRFARRSS